MEHAKTEFTSDFDEDSIKRNLKQSILESNCTEVNSSTLEAKQHKGHSASFGWILISCIEEALSFALEFAPSTIVLFFITRNNTQVEVSGFGLGQVWSNSIGQGIFYGIGSGVETMSSHAHGAKNYPLVGLLYQKAIVISMIIFIPIALAMVFADNILSLWNDDQQFTSIAGEYCLYSIPGLFSASLYYALKATLNAQNEYRIQVYTAGANLILVFGYSFLFIEWLGMGVKGAACVFFLSEIGCLGLLHTLVRSKKILSRCYVPWSRECLKELWSFVKVAGPIGSIVAAEWIVFELTSIVASNLATNEYSAHIVLSNFSAMCFQFQIGYSTAACTFIGNEMGNKNVKNALAYTRYAFYIIAIHVIIVILPLYFLRDQIAQFFTVDQDVNESMLSVYYIFLICFTIDSVQSIITAYMRAIAQENYSCVSYFLSYGAVGLTSSALLAYIAGYQLKGIWFGTAIGIILYILMQLVQIARVDIHEMAEVIALRVKEDKLNDEDIDEDSDPNRQEEEEEISVFEENDGCGTTVCSESHQQKEYILNS